MNKYLEAKRLWLEFGDVPMDPETECLDEAWNGFPKGTHREDIWHWFEETFDVSVAEDLMGFGSAEDKSDADDKVKKLIEAVSEYGLHFCWTDNDIIEALVNLGVPHEDFVRCGYGAFVEEYFLEYGPVETWADMQKKYPMDRDEMTEEEEFAFVEDCFRLYEQEGFSDRYWSPLSDNVERCGLPVEIVGRVEFNDGVHDLSVLPMWKARLDGCEFEVFPEEVVPSEMRANGCNWFGQIEHVSGLIKDVTAKAKFDGATSSLKSREFDRELLQEEGR